MKKSWLVLLLAMLMTLTACGGNKKEAKADGEGNVIEDLKIQFVPSREPDLSLIHISEPTLSLIHISEPTRPY